MTAKKSASSGDQTIASNPIHESRIPVSLRCWKAHLFVWLTAAIGLFADLGSKQWAVQTIGDPGPIIAGNSDAKPLEPIVLISPNYLVLETWHNPGAVWGIGGGNTVLLVAASVLALGFLFYLFATTRADQRLGHIALGMLFAGALGNLYDRVFNDGNVIDFIVADLGFFPFNPWPTFNLADAWLVIGVALLLISFYRAWKRTAAANSEPSQSKS